jgi:hypothetical protein
MSTHHLEAFVSRVQSACRNEPHFNTLFLSGSLAGGSGDEFSDIDFLSVAEPAAQATAAARWREIVEGLETVVFWGERQWPGFLLNAITEDWMRCDLYITSPKDFAGRAQNQLRPIVDINNLHDTLPATLPPRQPSAKRISAQINEVIRILGLAPVGLGRGEYVTSVLGVSMLREQLTNLMLEDVTRPDLGGILHLSKLLPPEDIKVLEGLPYPGPNPDELIAADVAIARAFFPRARRLAAQVGLEWPEAFEAATKKRVQSVFGPDFSW